MRILDLVRVVHKFRNTGTFGGQRLCVMRKMLVMYGVCDYHMRVCEKYTIKKRNVDDNDFFGGIISLLN